MPYTRDLTGVSHDVPIRRETSWGDDVTNLLLDLVTLLNGTFQAVTAVGAATAIDVTDGHNITLTLNASTALTLTNTRNGDRYYFTIINGGSYTITWPTVKWRSGMEPALTASGTDCVCLIKHPTLGYLGEYALSFA